MPATFEGPAEAGGPDAVVGLASPFLGLACLAFIVLARFFLGKGLDRHPALQRMTMAALALLAINYLWWRFTVTVLPANDLSAQSVFVWTLFLIELLAWADTTVLFLEIARRTDRSPEADAHERRLRASDPALLPSVDVFIATYNESREVVEKSIVGAAGLDWPAERLRVWVLDDGRRPWLEAFARDHGVGYLTRPDNAHAKAGNINAALARTDGAFVLVLDADFVPQHNFLYRTAGFFDDPATGIVQVPHNFFNHDPLQTGMDMRTALPDEQRLFFDVIMPGRDGWDCAFCCGSNGIIRRSAIEAAGGGLPTTSVTEDILLTLVLLRKGFRTRYLGERLAVGLAPESLAAYFVQRMRWARGGIQTLFLRDGPLGPRLRPMQRLLFLPLHWLSQPLIYTTAILTPAIYLLTGLRPLLNADTQSVLLYQVPAVLGAIATVRMFARGQFVPLAAAAHSVMQAVRLLPVVFGTLIRPFGHAFKVTPKGAEARDGRLVDRPTLWFALLVMFATLAGLALNSHSATRIIDDGALVPIVAFWSIVNILVLAVVARTALQAPPKRGEERFELRLPCILETVDEARGAETRDLSMTGAALITRDDGLRPGDWVVLTLPEIGRIAARVARRNVVTDDTASFGLQFWLPASAERSALIRRLYASGLSNAGAARDVGRTMLQMLRRVFLRETQEAQAAPVPLQPPPDWALALLDEAPPATGALTAPGSREGRAA